MLKWILANPLKSIGAIVFGVPVIDFLVKRKAVKKLNAPVLKKLASGTKPSITQDGSRVMIPRQEIAEDLANLFLPQSNNDSSKFLRFGARQVAVKQLPSQKCIIYMPEESCTMKSRNLMD